jgi:hypothetical protein
MKLGEALLFNVGVGVDQKDVKDAFVTGPHSIKASFTECCGPEFMYTPLFHERSLQEVCELAGIRDLTVVANIGSEACSQSFKVKR